MVEENIVQEIMEEFRSRTGLLTAGATAVHRYLWTDAFAVCNYLTLYKQSNREEYLHLALGLVDQVHEILGRHREDDPRHGWISGLDEREGRLHPTAGGLRIGKKLPERQPDEPLDENLEWERDGQYFHYLTKWMHTLCRVSRIIDNQTYTAWAGELAGQALSAFSYTAGDGSKRMYWKMSIDLSRPLVASMGHHDPLDGLITYLEIRQLIGMQQEIYSSHLEAEIDELADMCRGVNWTTPDTLGLGGLLTDAYRLAQLLQRVEEGEGPAEVCAEIGLEVTPERLVALQRKYEAGGRSWEALIDGRYGHVQKVTADMKEWLYERKRQDKTLTGPELVKAIRDAGGNKYRAAKILGIPRSSLYSKLKKFGLTGL